VSTEVGCVPEALEQGRLFCKVGFCVSGLCALQMCLTWSFGYSVSDVENFLKTLMATFRKYFVVLSPYRKVEIRNQMDNVFANRLSSARKMAGMSLQDLEDKLEKYVTRQTLHKYEQGKMKPDSQALLAMSNVLGVPVDYFYSVPQVKVELKNIDYRKYSSKISKTEQIAVEEKAKENCERYLELEHLINPQEKSEYFSYDKIISTPEDAEEAAKELRSKWKLGYDPIPDVVEMLEDKGYKVIELDAPDGFDGMKADVDGKKIIVLKKSKKQGEDVVRKRLTALHELAHHSLKLSGKLSGKEEERLCHAFASAVLYPADMALKELSKDRFHFYQNELQLIKERWGISFTAVFSRALQLKIITDYIYRRFNVGYKERKLHLNEPGRFMSKEKPVRMERLVYLGLSKEILTVNEAAYYLGVSAWKFREQLHQIV
jgi:Zn-dependent peptidase ImmA (M78 family)/DNA-binding XRE family transcriptional regulator